MTERGYTLTPKQDALFRTICQKPTQIPGPHRKNAQVLEDLGIITHRPDIKASRGCRVYAQT